MVRTTKKSTAAASSTVVVAPADDPVAARKPRKASRKRARRAEIKKAANLGAEQFYPATSIRSLIKVTLKNQHASDTATPISISPSAVMALREALLQRSQTILAMTGDLTRDVRKKAISTEHDVAFAIEATRNSLPPRWADSSISFAVARGEKSALIAV